MDAGLKNQIISLHLINEDCLAENIIGVIDEFLDLKKWYDLIEKLLTKNSVMFIYGTCIKSCN